jgi:hypothetical protein
MNSVEHFLGHIIDVSDYVAVALAVDISFKESPIIHEGFNFW